MININSKFKAINPRLEHRFIINKQDLPEFILNILKISKRKSFKTNYNHTIYFNNKEHEVPFEISVKGRKYSESNNLGYFNLNEKWIFEIKEDIIINKLRLRKKHREILTLKNMINKVENISELGGISFKNKIEPYVASVYKRTHYVVNKEKGFRITIDTDTNYYLFDNLKYTNIGQEDFVRIEIKIPKSAFDLPEINLINEYLARANAESTTSKKDTAYNYLSEYLISKFNPPKNTDTEIEAKFLLSKENQNIINDIKSDILRYKLIGFRLKSNFPYTLESGKLHRYVTVPNSNNIYRISIKGNKKKLILKNKLELMKDKFDLNCIITRREITIENNSEIINYPYKEIYRKRKYIVLENNNQNTYAILVDRCTVAGKELYEVEVESVLFSPTKEEIDFAVEQISTIGNYLVNKYKFLTPVSLTKYDWVIN